jgi:hypothetical protein
MKNYLLLVGFLALPVQAQITFFNDSSGQPLGTANQVGRITYFNSSTGQPLGTAINQQPIQPYYVPQFNNQPIPRVPVAPLYPVRMK